MSVDIALQLVNQAGVPRERRTVNDLLVAAFKRDVSGIRLPKNRRNWWYMHAPEGREACVLRRTPLLPSDTVAERANILFNRGLVERGSVRAKVISILVEDGIMTTNDLGGQLGDRPNMPITLGRIENILTSVGLVWHSRLAGGSKTPRLKAHELRMDIASELALHRKAAIAKADGIVRNPEVAEDIVSAKIAIIIHKVKNEGLILDDIKSYLLKAVQHGAINYLRDQKIRKRVDGPNVELIASTPFLAPDAFHGHDFETLIKDLPEIQKEILRLVFIHGLKNKEIAGLLSMHPGTVASAKSKALSYLREFTIA